MSEPDSPMVSAAVKPILNGRVELTSVAELAELYSRKLGVQPGVLVEFARILLQKIKWDFVKSVTRGIEQCADILINPDHFEKVKQKRARDVKRGREREEEHAVQQLVESADPVGRLRRLFHERKLWADALKRCDTNIAVIRREWNDVLPPEIWDELDD